MKEGMTIKDVKEELKEVEEYVRSVHKAFITLISKLPPEKRKLSSVTGEWPKDDSIESILTRIKKGSFTTKTYLEEITRNLYGGK